MVKIEAGKSRRWYAGNCMLCRKPFSSPRENRVKITAELLSGRIVEGYAHEDCARQAQIQQAAESVAAGVST